MSPEKANPAEPVTAAGLGMCFAVAASNPRPIAPALDVQAAFLRRCFGLRPDFARVVAALAFGVTS